MQFPDIATHLGAAVLVLAGTTKVVRHDPAANALRALGLPASRRATMALGIGEVAVGTVGLMVGGRSAGGAIAAVWLALTAAAIGLRRRETPDCGCFGVSGTGVTSTHVVLDAAFATLALWAAVGGFQAVPGLLDGEPRPVVALYVLLLAVGSAAVGEVATSSRDRTGPPATATTR